MSSGARIARINTQAHTYGQQALNTKHQYGNKYAMSKNRDAISGEGIGSRDSNNWTRFVEFFGIPRREAPQEPYSQYARSHFDLPEAYHGRNVYLEEILVTYIREADQWPITEMFPWDEWTTGMSISWDRWIFDDRMLERVPEQSAGRLLTSRKEQGEDHMVRYGIALLLEHGFYNKPDGQEQYRMNLIQIATATTETFCHGAMLAAMDPLRTNIPKRHGRSEEMDLDDERIPDHIQWDLDGFGCVQKTENGLDWAFEQCRTTLRQRLRKEGNFAVVPNGAGKYTASRPENNYFFITGTQAGPFRERRLGPGGMTVHESRGFRIGYGEDDVDPCFSLRSIGGFFSLMFAHLERVPYDEYKTEMMNTFYFNEASDSVVELNYKHALLKCGLFRKGKNERWELGKLANEFFAATGGDQTVGDFITGVGMMPRTIRKMRKLDPREWRDFFTKFVADRVANRDPLRSRAEMDNVMRNTGALGPSLIWNAESPGPDPTLDYNPPAGTRDPDATMGAGGADLGTYGGVSITYAGGHHTYGGGSGSSDKGGRHPPPPPTHHHRGAHGRYTSGGGHHAFKLGFWQSLSGDIHRLNAALAAVVMMHGASGDAVYRDVQAKNYAVAIRDAGREAKLYQTELLNRVGLAVDAAKHPRATDIVLQSVIGQRWLLGRESKDAAAPNEKDQKWNISTHSYSYGVVSSRAVHATADGRGGEDENRRLVVVGAPRVTYLAASGAAAAPRIEPRPWHVRVYPITAAEVGDTACVARALGDALFVFQLMGKKAPSALDAKEPANAQSIADMLKVVYANLGLIISNRAAANLNQFKLHPFSFSWKASFDGLLELLRSMEIDAVMSYYNSSEQRIALLNKSKTVFDQAVTSVDEAEVIAFAAAHGHSGAESSSAASSEQTSGPGMPTRVESSEFERTDAMMGYIAGRVQLHEEMRVKALMNNPDLYPESDATTAAAAPGGHQWREAALYQMRPYFSFIPKLYDHCPNLIRDIYRRRVLDANVVGDTHTGTMSKPEFFKIMTSLEHYWQAERAQEQAEARRSRGSYRYVADEVLMAILLELYYCRFIDIPYELRRQVATQAMMRRGFALTASGLAEFRDLANESVGEAVWATAKHIQHIMSYLSDSYFQLTYARLDKQVRDMVEKQAETMEEEADNGSAGGMVRRVRRLLNKRYPTGAAPGSAGVRTRDRVEEIDREENLPAAFSSGEYSKEDLTLAGMRNGMSDQELSDLLCSMPIEDGEFFRFAADHNFPPYIGLLAFRPYQTYEMGTIIMMDGFGGAGNTFIGDQNMMLGDNVYQKTIFGSFTIYGRTLVTNSTAITHLRDAYCKRYVGGNGGKIWDPENQTDVRNHKAGVMKKDMFLMAVPINERITRNMLDVSGHYNADLGATNYANSAPCYSTAAIYRKFWKFDNSSNHLDRPLYAQYHRPQMNTLCFQDHQVRFVYAGSGGHGEFKDVVRNRGAWGENVYDGCGRARRGVERFIQKTNFSHNAITSITY